MAFYPTPGTNSIPIYATTMNQPRGGAMAFSLDMFNNYSRWRSSFEEYKINKIVVKFRWMRRVEAASAPNVTGLAGTNICPMWMHAVDHDDAIPPTQINHLALKSGAKRFFLSGNFKKWSVAFKPAILNMAYKTSVSTAYSPTYDRWIDTADYSTPHYGLKWMWEADWGSGAGIAEIPLGDVHYDIFAYCTFRKLKADTEA